MYEVELKVRADHQQVREHLEELDATPAGTVHQEDTYFDAPGRNFAETDEALRIRRERRDSTESVSLTYKGPLVERRSKTREEAETRVDDGTALASILEGLGYEPAATVEKERTRFGVDGCTVTLDSVAGLGEFVEVETETEQEVGADSSEAEAELAAVRGEVTAVMDRLGLDPDEQIQTSYLGLLLGADESKQ